MLPATEEAVCRAIDAENARKALLKRLETQQAWGMVGYPRVLIEWTVCPLVFNGRTAARIWGRD